MTTPVKIKVDPGQAGRELKQIEDNASKFNDLLDPFSANRASIGQIPFYSSGARALIRVGGKPLGVCQEIRWQISYNSEPIMTVDSQFPWDIDIGHARIGASLSQIVDPTGGPETDYLSHTMAASLHQPYVEMQVLDKIGTSLFFARGMFTSISGGASRGAISTWNATFVGVAYQHYVAQNFEPYSDAGKVSGLIGTFTSAASKLTGGIF